MGQGTARETAGVTTRLIVSYVRRHLGDDGVARVLELAGETRPIESLEDELGWSSYEQKIALFEAAEVATGDPDVARRIGEALLAEQLAAPLRLVIGALGSPQQVLRSCARANAKFSTNSTMEALEWGPGRAVVTYRVDDGYTPSRHDCNYTQGVLTQASALFGLPPADVAHAECQVRGAHACRYEVTWQRRRWFRGKGRRTAAPSGAVEMLEARLADLEATLADLVSPRELDDVLERIANRAGAAVRGQRFLLVVQLDGEAAPRVQSEGFDGWQAAELAHGLLAEGGDGPDGAADRLVAEVASSRRQYGYLATYLPSGKGFLPAEEGQLAAYARLAAAALDSATAVRDARRGEATARAILALAHGLAQERDEPTAARRIAEAVPAVVGCDRSSLLIQEGDRLRVAASYVEGRTCGDVAFELPPDAVASLLRTHEPWFATPTHPEPWVSGLLERFDAAAFAVAPVIVRGTFLGLVVAHWSRGCLAPIHEPSVLRALAGVADHAGVAITGLRLLQQAQHQADHDPLTGLVNRARFAAELDRAITARRRASGGCSAVCFLDLDGFKAINDRHGHAVGDQLLVEVARRLRQHVRTTDVVARISGDEFAVLLHGLAGRDDAMAVADALVEAVAAPVRIDGTELGVRVSIGIAEIGQQGTSPSALLRAADNAMYRAKAAGGGGAAWSEQTPAAAPRTEAIHGAP